MSKSQKDPSRVVVLKVRSSYMRCVELYEDDNENKICTTGVLISKKDKTGIKAIRVAIDAAAKKKFNKTFKPDSRKYSYPLRDGDVELEEGDKEGEEYKGHYFIATAKCYKVPQLVDQSKTRVEDQEEREEMLVSGNYFNMSLTFKGFEGKENSGVRCQLNNLMFAGEGERLDGGKSAEQDFEGVDSEEPDDDDDESDDDEW